MKIKQMTKEQMRKKAAYLEKTRPDSVLLKYLKFHLKK